MCGGLAYPEFRRRTARTVRRATGRHLPNARVREKTLYARKTAKSPDCLGARVWRGGAGGAKSVSVAPVLCIIDLARACCKRRDVKDAKDLPDDVVGPGAD